MKAAARALLLLLPGATSFLAPARTYATRMATTRAADAATASSFAWTTVDTDFCLLPQGLSQGGKGGKISTCKRAVSTRDLPDAPGFHLSSHADHWPQAQCGS